MKRSEIVWSQYTPLEGEPSLSAILTDKDGLMWKAAITQEWFGLGARWFVAMLMCQSAGKMRSAGGLKSINAAQVWCYEKLGIE